MMHRITGHMIHRIGRGYRLVGVIVLVAASLTLSACGFFGGGSTPTQEISPAEGVVSATTPGQTSSPTPATKPAAKPNATGTPGNASVDVSPSEVTEGSIVLTLWVEAAQPAFDPARVPPTPPAGNDQKDGTQPKGYAVLGGSTLRVTNNFDAAQNPPADQAQEVVRHVAVQIKEKESGQLVPHINVNMDLLREGRSVLQDQPLVPMVQSGGSVAQMHYGNNVKFPGKGEYQVFVRLEPSPLLGSDSRGVAQFNVSIR